METFNITDITEPRECYFEIDTFAADTQEIIESIHLLNGPDYQKKGRCLRCYIHPNCGDFTILMNWAEKSNKRHVTFQRKGWKFNFSHLYNINWNYCYRTYKISDTEGNSIGGRGRDARKSNRKITDLDITSLVKQAWKEFLELSEKE